jgi:hypothetical protein
VYATVSHTGTAAFLIARAGEGSVKAKWKDRVAPSPARKPMYRAFRACPWNVEAIIRWVVICQRDDVIGTGNWTCRDLAENGCEFFFIFKNIWRCQNKYVPLQRQNYLNI